MDHPKVVKRIWQVHGSVKNYHWGKPASESLISPFIVVANHELVPDENYAEIWFGTHDTGPSHVVLSTSNISNLNSDLSPSSGLPSSSRSKIELLSHHLFSHAYAAFGPHASLLHLNKLDMIPHEKKFQTSSHDLLYGYGCYLEYNPGRRAQNSPCLGLKSTQSTYLPFLLKILSIGHPLSIQVHPDKNFAEYLHQSNPCIYRDPYHKPEMVIALKRMVVMCGFRRLDQILHDFQVVPEFKLAVGLSEYQEFIDIYRCHNLHCLGPSFLDPPSCNCEIYALRIVFTSLMNADKILIAKLQEKLVKKISDSEMTPLVQKWIHDLQPYYKGDIGVFCLFIFNVILLKPGDAIYLPPNEPHSYLSGDCIECMAASDNVIRCGLTPKFVDKDTLIRMLRYKSYCPAIFRGKKVDDERFSPIERIYSPPVPEFQVGMIQLRSENGEKESCTIPSLPVPCIMIVYEGSGTIIQKNKIFKFPSNSTDNIDCYESSSDDDSHLEFTLAPGFSYLIYANTDFVLTTNQYLKIYRAHSSLFLDMSGIVMEKNEASDEILVQRKRQKEKERRKRKKEKEKEEELREKEEREKEEREKEEKEKEKKKRRYRMKTIIQN